MTTESFEFRRGFRELVHSRVKSRYGHGQLTVAELLVEVEAEAKHWAEVFESGKVQVTITRGSEGRLKWNVTPHV